MSDLFQNWLFFGIMIVFAVNFTFSFAIQGHRARQNASNALMDGSKDIIKAYNKIKKAGSGMETLYYFTNGSSWTFDIFKSNGYVLEGNHKNFTLTSQQIESWLNQKPGTFFYCSFFNKESYCRKEALDDGYSLLTQMPVEEIYADRDMQALETAYADILLVSSVYVLISLLVQRLVVNNLDLVNASLNKITHGDLNEVVNVRNSSEFASLSDDINQTVGVLKGYIDAAEKRYEEELELARTIQASALPQNFDLPLADAEIYAIMDPAKEVGGDFYDFFFIGEKRLALVIADVSGKGIPASLFMMRSKTALRNLAEAGNSPAEIFAKVNDELCEGNDAEMFVTVWIGIINLETGLMQCANAGHEYPVLKRADGDFELIKDKHSLAMAAMPGVKAKEYEMQLHPGDRLFVYTDGVPEAINEGTEQYGPDRMLAVLNSVKDCPMSEILPQVRQDISDFVGKAEQFDDITMLGFTYGKQ